MAFVSTSFTDQTADTNNTVPKAAVPNCVCYDRDGKKVNLDPLQRTDGQPRFTVPGSDSGGKYQFSFNPCRSFSLGPPQRSDCFGDVAICMWTKNQARYQNIGRQSTVSCGLDPETLTPQLEYTNTQKFPNWKAIVILKCDPPRTSAEDAKFEVINDAHNPRKFVLSHSCACPGGCPTTAPSTKPASAGKNKLEYGLVGAFCSLLIVVPLVYWRKPIWRCITRQNNQDNGREPLIHGDGGVDYAANNFIDSSNVPKRDLNKEKNSRMNSAGLC